MQSDENPTSYPLTLSPPAGFDYPFECNIHKNQHLYNFQISAYSFTSQSNLIKNYDVDETQHQSFINFYQQLHHDFGLGKPVSKSQPSTSGFEIDFKEVLLENLHPDML